MTEQEQREAVIQDAMTWLRTPHHNYARVKGHGVDCGQFPIAVYSACGLMPDIQPEKYKPDFHLHNQKEWYLSIAQQYGKELPEGEKPKKGDFAIYKIGRVYSHGAIVIDWPHVIHAYTGQGVVLADGLQGHLGSKHVKGIKFFTLWGK